jgi:hypothetical protein
MKYNKNYSRSPGFDNLDRKVVIANDETPAIDEETGEPIKRKSKLKTPRPKNSETLISHVPTPGFESVKIHHEIEPHGGLKALQAKGLKITSYVETDGSGAPITNRKRYDDDE